MARKMVVLLLTVLCMMPALVSEASTTSSFGVTASGTGFVPNSAVSVTSYDGSTMTKTANGNGAISFNFSIPIGAKEGVYTLRAEGARKDANNNTQTLSCSFTLTSSAITNVTAPKESQIDEPYAELFRGPLSLTVIAGQKTQPVKSIDREMLPYTGGAALWIMLAAGLVLASAGIGVKAFKKD